MVRCRHTSRGTAWRKLGSGASFGVESYFFFLEITQWLTFPPHPNSSPWVTPSLPWLHEMAGGRLRSPNFPQTNAQLAARQPCRGPLQAPRRSNQQRQVNLQLACRVREPHCPALRHQPSQQRMLRKHGMRTRGSELVKVCGEVVKSTVMYVTI